MPPKIAVTVLGIFLREREVGNLSVLLISLILFKETYMSLYVEVLPKNGSYFLKEDFPPGESNLSFKS